MGKANPISERAAMMCIASERLGDGWRFVRAPISVLWFSLGVSFGGFGIMVQGLAFKV